MKGTSNKLRPCQIQVWKMLAESFTSKHIALIFGISNKAVEWHRAKLSRKMNMNLAQLTREAIRIGLIEL